MPNPIPSADQIQRQMQQVRTDLREDVREWVESAREMTMWQRYVQAYPWTCLAAAAFVGYVIIPSRTRSHTDPNLVAELVKQQVAQQTATVKPPTSGIVSSLVSGAAGMAVNTLLQGGVSILGKQLQRYMEQSLHRLHEPHSNGEGGQHG